MSKIVCIYKNLLRRHFVAVQAVQTGILMGTGDIIAQTVLENKPFQQIDKKRTLQFVGLGTLFVVSGKVIKINHYKLAVATIY